MVDLVHCETCGGTGDARDDRWCISCLRKVYLESDPSRGYLPIVSNDPSKATRFDLSPWPADQVRPMHDASGVRTRNLAPMRTEIENKIQALQDEVEAMGGSVALSAAARLLSVARDRVADHVEGNGHYDRREGAQ